MIFDIPLPWDALHLATIENLPGYAPGFVDFDQPTVDPVGMSLFVLRQSQLGEIGKLTLRKLSQTLTQIRIDDAPNPDDKEAWPEFTANKKRSIDEILKDSGKLRQKKDDLAGRRQEHLQKVIQVYCNRLLYDLTLWTSNKVIPPPYLIAWAGLSEWPDTSSVSTII